MQRFFGPALIAAAFIALAIWTWGTWPDVVIDFGRELYVPWRITRGELLYRDIAYFNGAFSPYFNALIFGLFSASVRTSFIANLTLLALFTLLVYRLLVAIGDRFSAFLSMVVFLCVFAFGQLVGFGNYNFIPAPAGWGWPSGAGWGTGANSPAVPAGTGSANAVRNRTNRPVLIYQVGAVGTHVIDSEGNNLGSAVDRALGVDPTVVQLNPFERIYHATTVPTSWQFYGL